MLGRERGQVSYERHGHTLVAPAVAVVRPAGAQAVLERVGDDGDDVNFVAFSINAALGVEVVLMGAIEFNRCPVSVKGRAIQSQNDVIWRWW